MTSRFAGRKVLVTGATGFVGGALASRLAEQGAHVVGVGRSIPASARSDIEWITANLEDPRSLHGSMRDVEAVFHVGGAVGHYGPRDHYMRGNVDGTRNIIAACRANGVKSLIFTSTPSVIADGTPHFNVDESEPYSRRFESPYSESKAIAEQIVRTENRGDLRTVCIRPHMIWGSASNHWVRGLKKLAASGFLYQVGHGKNRVGMTFIDDCVDAHVEAWRAVESDDAVGGQVFFVHSGSPVYLWDWVNRLTAALGLPQTKGRVPRLPVRAAAKVCDALVRVTKGRLHFPVSSYLITELTTDHYSRIDRAREWLSYLPKVSVEAGIARMTRLTAPVPSPSYQLTEASPITG